MISLEKEKKKLFFILLLLLFTFASLFSLSSFFPKANTNHELNLKNKIFPSFSSSIISALDIMQQ
jgi:hypothetical protein